MTVNVSVKRRLADLLMSHAASRLGSQRSEWADAMARESSELFSDDERLRWSAGCVIAGYRARAALVRITYPAALVVGVMLMAAYQWNADENLGTLAVLCLIGAALGVLEPRRNLISGTAIGLVVAAVNCFETISGARPAYEATAHSLPHDARWIVLVVPALIACAAGGHAGRNFRLTSGAAL
jgi:hypothetical protein